MAATVRTNTTIAGAFQVWCTATNIQKGRAQSPVITDAGNVGTKRASGVAITGNLTFSVDSLVGVGLDLDAWEENNVGLLVEIDRGPDHLILRNCTISSIGDSANPGAAQRDVTVAFNAQTESKISNL